MRILVVEDERDLNRIICKRLTAAGYTADACYDGLEALDYLAGAEYDAAIFDVMMPKLDGFSAVRRMREGGDDTPVLFLTARDAVSDRVAGLDLGANDYLIKPFSFDELMARIRTALRHGKPTVSTGDGKLIQPPYSSGDLVIDFDKRVVMLNGEDIHLTQIEYKLVSLLAKNAGKVLTYDFILKEIWGQYADTDNQILRVNMANIRRKLESNPAEPHYIFTEIGVGYRMKE